ncbi:MAG: hypothetical protein ACTSYD_00845 [Candidatus Heimdallarchaeaceae archaeon]
MDDEHSLENITYSPKDAVELVNEFQDLYSSLESQIQQFLTTQPVFLKELRTRLKKEIGFLAPHKKNIALAVYGLIITEDIIKDYDAEAYADDLSMLLEATNKKLSCTDEEFLGLLTSLINSMKTAMYSTGVIMQNFIELKSRGLDDDIIIAILIRRLYFPAVVEAIMCFDAAGMEIDNRFVIALFSHSIEVLLQQNKAIEKANTIGKLYLHLQRIYPLSSGEDLYFDLIMQSLIVPYYDILSKVFKYRIELKKSELMLQFETAQKEFAQSLHRQLDEGKTEQLLAAIEKTLYEVMTLKWEMNEERRNRLSANIEKVLKRMAIEEFGVQDIAEQERYMKYLQDTWFSIFLEYPQMVLPLIDIRDYSTFVKDPSEYIKNNKQSILHQLTFRIRRYMKGEKFTPHTLAEAFSRLLFEILQNPSVQSLDF